MPLLARGSFMGYRIRGRLWGMSRGPGRVQRAVLHALEGGPLDAYTLTLHARASEESTRRALRTLAAAGRVRFLGFAGGGRGVWCLAEDEDAARAAMLPPDVALSVARLMGARFARRLARFYTSTL